MGVLLEALFRVIVIEGFDIWALFRAQVSWKAAEQGGSTVKGTGSEEGGGSLTCRRNWTSSSSSWRIVVHSLRRSFSLILRSTRNEPLGVELREDTGTVLCWLVVKFELGALFAPGLVL